MTRRLSLFVVIFLLSTVCCFLLGIIVGNTKADNQIQVQCMECSDDNRHNIGSLTLYESFETETDMFSSEEYRKGHAAMGW